MSRSWITVLLQRTYILKYLSHFLGIFGDAIVNLSFANGIKQEPVAKKPAPNRFIELIWYTSLTVLVTGSLWLLLQFISKPAYCRMGTTYCSVFSSISSQCFISSCCYPDFKISIKYRDLVNPFIIIRDAVVHFIQYYRRYCSLTGRS